MSALGVVDARGAASVTQARIGDALTLATRLRPADRRELEALGRRPTEALLEAFDASDEVFTLWAHGAGRPARPAALFGVAPFAETARIAAPWLLGAPELERLARPFLRRCRPWTERLGRGRDLLVNRVDARNALHVRWLRWCGFQFVARCPGVGPERRLFYEFAKICGPASAHDDAVAQNGRDADEEYGHV